MSGRIANRAEVRRGINLLNYLASRDTSSSPDSDYELIWNDAQQMALIETAKKAKEFIASHMQRDWNKDGERSSAGGEPPAKRTGSLVNSLKVQLGDLKSELVTKKVFSKRMSFNKRHKTMYRKSKMVTSTELVRYNKNVARVTAGGSEHDKSKGRRLQLYSIYLQTGWVLGGGRPGMIKRLPKGQRGDTPKRQRKNKIGEPGRVQPPRPYLELPIKYNYVTFLQQFYRQQLEKYLPGHLKKFASRSILTVTYEAP